MFALLFGFLVGFIFRPHYEARKKYTKRKKQEIENAKRSDNSPS